VLRKEKKKKKGWRKGFRGRREGCSRLGDNSFLRRRYSASPQIQKRREGKGFYVERSREVGESGKSFLGTQ